MKNTYLLLLLFMAAPFQSHSQNLVNNKKDTLTYYESFYYSTLTDKKNFKQSLDSGFYVLVFAESVDLEKLKFNINRWNDAPIIYLRHSGFFSFEIKEPAVTNFNFNYGGSLNSAGPFANLYRIASPFIGSPCPDFKLKEISGSEFRKVDLLGKVNVFLLWDPKIGKSKMYYQLLNDLATKYKEVNFVALSNVLASEIQNFKKQHPDSNFKFANDKF